MRITKINHPSGEYNFRFAFGQHFGQWYVRLDLWRRGWRLMGDRR